MAGGNPEGAAGRRTGTGPIPGPALKGTLRPYQRAGTRWMHLLSSLGLGACLADDMGLGKTIQVLSLLLVEQSRAASPSLLVAPASLLGNWAAEIEKFAPGLKAAIVHPSAMPADQIKQFTPERAAEYDLVDHQLRLVAADAGAGGDVLALRHPGRGAGDQEPGRAADQGGEGAAGQGADRADRNAGGEPPRRPVVDLRFHQSGSAGQRQAVFPLRQGTGRADRTIRTARCGSWCGRTSCGG